MGPRAPVWIWSHARCHAQALSLMSALIAKRCLDLCGNTAQPNVFLKNSKYKPGSLRPGRGWAVGDTPNVRAAALRLADQSSSVPCRRHIFTICPKLSRLACRDELPMLEDRNIHKHAQLNSEERKQNENTNRAHRDTNGESATAQQIEQRNFTSSLPPGARGSS